jgi:hypothetical protein
MEKDFTIIILIYRKVISIIEKARGIGIGAEDG